MKGMPQILIGIVLSIFSFTPLCAESVLYPCDAAKNGAIVGVWPGNGVNVTADRNNSECRFGINGATAGSPPEDQVIAALDAIAKRQMANNLRDGNVNLMALSLSGAAPFKELPESLLALLKGSTDKLAECLDAFEQGASEYSGFQNDNVGCRVSASAEPVISGGSVRVLTGKAVLQVGVRDGQLEHYLFLPAPIPPNFFRP